MPAAKASATIVALALFGCGVQEKELNNAVVWTSDCRAYLVVLAPSGARLFARVPEADPMWQNRIERLEP